MCPSATTHTTLSVRIIVSVRSGVSLYYTRCLYAYAYAVLQYSSGCMQETHAMEYTHIPRVHYFACCMHSMHSWNALLVTERVYISCTWLLQNTLFKAARNVVLDTSAAPIFFPFSLYLFAAPYMPVCRYIAGIMECTKNNRDESSVHSSAPRMVPDTLNTWNPVDFLVSRVGTSRRSRTTRARV